MSKENQLLEMLRSLPNRSFITEIDFMREVVPNLVSLLGYQETETFYGHSSKQYRADVVMASSVISKPWIIIELKSKKTLKASLAIQQVKQYLKSFNSSIGVILSPASLILIKIKPYEQIFEFNLQTIEIDEINQIFNIISRDTQLLDHIEFEESYGKAVQLIELVEKSITNDEKGKSLENLARFLLESIPSLRCKYPNLETKSSEIDLVIEYDHLKGELPLLEELGRYALIECKNWSKPVGVGYVRDFMGKLDKCKIKLGIIFSKNGVTGVNSGVDALREIQSRFDRDGIYILVFSLDELKEIKDGMGFYKAIDLKADRLRFDV